MHVWKGRPGRAPVLRRAIQRGALAVASLVFLVGPSLPLTTAAHATPTIYLQQCNAGQDGQEVYDEETEEWVTCTLYYWPPTGKYVWLWIPTGWLNRSQEASPPTSGMDYGFQLDWQATADLSGNWIDNAFELYAKANTTDIYNASRAQMVSMYPYSNDPVVAYMNWIADQGNGDASWVHYAAVYYWNFGNSDWEYCYGQGASNQGQSYTFFLENYYQYHYDGSPFPCYGPEDSDAFYWSATSSNVSAYYLSSGQSDDAFDYTALGNYISPWGYTYNDYSSGTSDMFMGPASLIDAAATPTPSPKVTPTPKPVGGKVRPKPTGRKPTKAPTLTPAIKAQITALAKGHKGQAAWLDVGRQADAKGFNAANGKLKVRDQLLTNYPAYHVSN
jgi:hypothetical protein